MSSDEERPIAENEAPTEVEQVSGQAIEPEQDATLTKEQFVAQMQRLTQRAKAAGLNPIQTMVQSYAKRGLMILEGLLAALETVEKVNPKKKKKN